MNVTKRELIYTGKARSIYSTDDPDIMILHNRDDLTAGNAAKKGGFAGKGSINNKISGTIFRHLEKMGIATHYINDFSENEVLVKRVDIIPLEVVVRNAAAGSFSAKYGVSPGTPLKMPLVEFFYKNDELGDPMLSASHIEVLDLATSAQVEEITKIAKNVNKILTEFFDKIDLFLIDFKIELGICKEGTILLADEISPDTCRLWDKKTNKSLDKDVFRKDLGDVSEAYKEVLRRMENGRI